MPEEHVKDNTTTVRLSRGWLLPSAYIRVRRARGPVFTDTFRWRCPGAVRDGGLGAMAPLGLELAALLVLELRAQLRELLLLRPELQHLRAASGSD